MISRIVFSGKGGQGLITAAIIFAEAAVFHEGLEATQSQSYGPEARGGSSRADVIVATEPILFPKVLEPNILIALSQEGYDKYAWIVRPGGIIVIDNHNVKSRSSTTARQVSMDFTRSIETELHTKLGVNVAVVGALAGIVNYMSLESLEKVVRSRFDGRFVENNVKALHLGYELAEAQKKSRTLSVF
jgi:2-oxoglutarate ferredoxin oxidoreductase subunit gamma